MSVPHPMTDHGSDERQVAKLQVEALLFSAGKHLDVETLASLTGRTPQDIKKALQALKQDYDARETSLMVVDEGTSWKLHVRERYLDLVRKIVADTELARPVLETLAVAAYKSPCLQSDVIKTRGQNAYEHLGLLLEMGFLARERHGRSFLLKLTDKFFDYFEVEGEKGIRELFKDVKAPPKHGAQSGSVAVPAQEGTSTEAASQDTAPEPAPSSLPESGLMEPEAGQPSEDEGEEDRPPEGA